MNQNFKSNTDTSNQNFLDANKHLATNRYYFSDFLEFMVRYSKLWLVPEWCAANGFDGLLDYLHFHAPEIINSKHEWLDLHGVAVKSNQTSVIALLDKWSVKSIYYDFFLNAARKNDTTGMSSMNEAIMSQETIEIVKGYNYEIFREAAECGNSQVASLLKTWHNVREMIKADNYYAFRIASKYGHVDLMAKLLQWSSEPEIRNMIRAQNYFAFRLAACNGYIEALELIKYSNQDQMREMIRAKDYFAFNKAVEYRQNDVLIFLKKCSSQEEMLKMIESRDYFSFRFAVSNNDMGLLLTLKEWSDANTMRKVLCIFMEVVQNMSIKNQLQEWKMEFIEE